MQIFKSSVMKKSKHAFVLYTNVNICMFLIFSETLFLTRLNFYFIFHNNFHTGLNKGTYLNYFLNIIEHLKL